MKLIFCTKCLDVFNLSPNREKQCHCGASKGMYSDNLNAWYSGEVAVPLGFHNSDFIDTIRNQPDSGKGLEFIAFVIPKECDTFKKQTVVGGDD